MYDHLIINNNVYTATAGPHNVQVSLGAIAWRSDSATQSEGWKICPDDRERVASAPGPPPPPNGNLQWEVVEGPCTVDDNGCALSPNYPAQYGSNMACKVKAISAGTVAPFDVSVFDVEAMDWMELQGQYYFGSNMACKVKAISAGTVAPAETA